MEVELGFSKGGELLKGSRVREKGEGTGTCMNGGGYEETRGGIQEGRDTGELGERKSREGVVENGRGG